MSQSMTLRRTRALLDHLHPLAPASAPLAAAGEQSPDVARRVTFSPDELRFFQNHGFLVVPGVVDGDACDTLRGEVLDICELDPGIGLTHAELLEGSSRDGDMLRQSAMHTEEQLLFTLRNSPALLRVASQVVDGQAMLYNGFTAVKGAGGGGLFDLHQDNMYTRHDNGDRTLPRTEGQNNDGYGSCGIWVALHDLPDVENGCLLVAVDSHKHGTLAGEDYSSDRGTDKQLPMDSPVRGYFREDVRWLDRSTGDENTGKWLPLASGDSPFQNSIKPVAKLGPQEGAAEALKERALRTKGDELAETPRTKNCP